MAFKPKLRKSEDEAHISGATGTMPLSVRQDTAAALGGTDGDYQPLITDANGRLHVINQNSASDWANDNQSSAQTNTALVSAPGAGLSIYVTDIHISNGATAGNVKLVEDTGGTPVDLLGPYYFAVNGGMVSNLKTPKKLTANKDLGYTSASVSTHSISIGYFIAP